ncbi:MAG TPA: pyridoxamine 5'-phosphate oxidase family protein [Actinomycetota bacterium]|nr:pyridoxamine 5'-phosphate oxidase family protein [Actinomycetota bacterium]
MASWQEVTEEAQELAAAVKEIFDAHRHKVLATLRKDGSPRISGTEVIFAFGDLWLGGMWRSKKALDLLRDPRFALHSATIDPDDNWPGDAKISGTVKEVQDQEEKSAIRQEIGEGPIGPFHLFRVNVHEMVLTRVGDPPDHLVIELWREGEGVRRFERK